MSSQERINIVKFTRAMVIGMSKRENKMSFLALGKTNCGENIPMWSERKIFFFEVESISLVIGIIWKGRIVVCW